jgi:tetratricopeptide (TPR) repeat protein
MPAKAGLQFEGRIRETLYASIEAAGLKIDTAPGRILRHPRQHAESRKAWIAHRDLALLLLETAEQKQPEPRTFLAQGEAYSHLGDYDRSRAAFIKAIELSKPGSTDMLEAYYGLLSDYDGDPFLRDCQMQVCISALEAFPFDAQLLLAMGNYLMRQNRVELACRAFESAVKIGQIDLSTWHLTELPELAASCLAAALEMQGKSDEAGRVLIEALDRHPESALLRQRTLQTYIKQGEIEPANPELAALTAALPGEREIDALESSTADTETVADSPESAGRRYRLDQSVTTLQPPHVKLPAIRQDDASKEMMAKET